LFFVDLVCKNFSTMDKNTHFFGTSVLLIRIVYL
jgi:hypothetical protein